jgi:hypothetical protein
MGGRPPKDAWGIKDDYWIPFDQFLKIAGGTREVLALKRELIDRGLLVMEREPLLHGKSYFVVIRHKPEKVEALGHALGAGRLV